jgi:RsiW-degrading membrane proteinase PrsW (M82 family)
MSEDKEHPEPKKMIFFTFVAGMMSAVALLLMRGFLPVFSGNTVQSITFFAALEEVAKVLFVMIVVFPTKFIDEPIDYVIYFVTGAIGFSALENILYLAQVATRQDIVSFLLVGNMRFLGATILHTATVAVVGIGLGMAFFKSRKQKVLYGLGAFIFGIGLHTLFNYFILLHTRQGILTTFAGIWFVAFIVIVVAGRLKHLHRFSKASSKA